VGTLGTAYVPVETPSLGTCNFYLGDGKNIKSFKKSIMAYFLFVIALCVVSAAASGEASPFLGLYSDPNHPDCYRKVVEMTTFSVYGQDNIGGEGVSCNTDDESQLNNWGPCPAFINSTHITVDLSAKGGPSDLLGTWDAETNRIVWADGNYWQHSLPAAKNGKK